MTRIILHIGHHKTGSTALQYSLAAHRKHLEKLGILYPKLPGWNFVHHALFPYFFGIERCDPFILRRLGRPGSQALDASFEAWNQVKRQLIKQQPKTLLLSSESFFYVGEKEQMQRVARILREVADELEIVLYVRNPAEFVLSSISTQIQMDPHFHWPPPDIRKAVIESYQYLQPDKLHVLKFDKAELENGDITEDFCSRILPPSVKISSSFSANETMSAEAMLLMKQYGERNNSSRSKPMPVKQQVFRRILKHLDRHVHLFRRPNLRPDAETSILRGSTDMDWLAANYNIRWQCPDSKKKTDGGNFNYGSTFDIADICQLDSDRKTRLQKYMSMLGLY